MQTRLEKQFSSITGVTVKEAAKFLKDNNYKLEPALNQYYSQDYTEIDRLFDKFKGNFLINQDEADLIGPNGTEKLIDELGLDPTDVVTIVLSWHMNCPAMCEFTRDGFRKGCKELHVSSIEELKSKIPEMKKELENFETMKQIYIYTFQIARQDNQKSLSLEVAISYWDLLIPRFKYLDLWKEFLIEKHGKAISKDTWNLFWDFQVDFDSFKNHDDDGMIRFT